MNQATTLALAVPREKRSITPLRLVYLDPIGRYKGKTVYHAFKISVSLTRLEDTRGKRSITP